MRTALGRWIGAAAERPLAAEAPVTPPPDLEELLESVERHPAIRAQDHRIEAAQAEIALGEDEYRPAWSLEVYYANRPEFSDMIGARVNYDLPLFTADRQDRRQGARLALRDESLAQREDAVRALRADAIESLRQWRDQSARVSRYDEIILPAARLRLAATEAAYVDSRSPLAAVMRRARRYRRREEPGAVDAVRGKCCGFTASEESPTRATWIPAVAALIAAAGYYLASRGLACRRTRCRSRTTGSLLVRSDAARRALTSGQVALHGHGPAAEVPTRATPRQSKSIHE
jgi:hypothetical protein